MCWQGVSTESLQPSTCQCGGRDPPPFDLVFPGSARSTVAPSTWSNDTLISVQTTALPTGVWRTGGGGGDTATISASVTPGGNISAEKWGSIHPSKQSLY